MTIDPQDNILVFGKFYNWVDIDPSPISDTLQGDVHSLFVAKYASDGSFVWANSLSHVGIYGTPDCIKTDAQGFIYIAGTYAFTVDFDAGPSVVALTASNNLNNAFFAKYEPNGGLVWVNGLEFSFSFQSKDTELALDSAGNIYVVGGVYRSVDMDPGPVQLLIASNDNSSSYFGKYTNDGDLIWPNGSTAYCACCRSKWMNMAMCCCPVPAVEIWSRSGVAMVLGPSAAFADCFAKYDPNGNYCWARIIGNNGYAGGIIEHVFTIHGDHQYMAGSFKQTGDFDPAPICSR